MTPRKRVRNDENTPIRAHGTSATYTPTPISFAFVDGSTPVPKKRRVAREFTAEDLVNLRRARARSDALKAEEREEMERIAAEEKRRLEAEAEAASLDRILEFAKAEGHHTLMDFLRVLFNTNDPNRSSQVTRTILTHGGELLNMIQARGPQIADNWRLSGTRRMISLESEHLAMLLQPGQKTTMSDILARFTLEGILQEAAKVAPSTYDLFQHIAFPDTQSDTPKRSRKNHNLILATTLCMLAKARNDHATEFQTNMGMYFLASGTSRTLFDVLNHAGLSLSYTQTVSKLKVLGAERLAEMLVVSRSSAFMIIWDNLNIRVIQSSQFRVDFESISVFI